jgi:hypothetical protein
MEIIPGLKQRRGWLLAAMLPLALLAGCAGGSGSGAGARATPTYPAPATPAPTITEAPALVNYTVSGPALPPFSDWRAAYIGQDGKLHLVSLDGKTDLVGVSLPSYGQAGTGVFTAESAPDGERLLYGDASGSTYIDLLSDTATVMPAARTGWSDSRNALMWSPDGQAVIINRPLQTNQIVRLPSGAITNEPPDNQVGNGMLMPTSGAMYGWLDANHLAVEDVAIEYPTPPTSSRVPTQGTVASLASQDIATGQIRPIVTLRSPTLGYGYFSLTPDASEALFYNMSQASLPITPDVQRIDIATGHMTRLYAIAKLLPPSQLLWRPHSHQAVVVTGVDAYQPIRFYLIDLDQDRVTPLNLDGFPLAWSPDGATLILETGKSLPPPFGQGSYTNGDGEEGPISGFNDAGIVGSGPYTLTAVSFGANWSVASSVTLTTQAMQIPVLGLVRNP